MSYFDATIPADSEGVKLGAGRIRAMKTSLNTIIAKIFDDSGNFLTKWVLGAHIANDAAVDGNRAIGSDHLKNNAVITRVLPDGVLSADATGRAKTADGYFSADATGRGKFADGIWTLAKLAWASFFTDAAAKASPVDADLLLIGDSAAGSAAKRITLSQVRQSTQFTTVEVTLLFPGSLNLAHGLGAVPRHVRWVLVCKVSDLGYGVGEEVDVLGARDNNNNNSQASVSADSLYIWITVGPHGWALLNKSTFVQSAVTPTSWKMKGYASL